MMRKENVNRNASASAYGWSFQVGAGISLMLDYVKDFTKLKMEGTSDDIELTLNEGKKIYAQAKSVTQIGNQNSASKNLTDALKVLSEDEQRGDAFKLIYITNIINPLSSKIDSAFKYEKSYDFSILSIEDQKKIIEKSGPNFPTDKFQLQIIYFFGDGYDKFSSIKEKIAEFLRNAIDDTSYSQRLLDNWFSTFMLNASDKPDNKKVDLTKKQVVFPIIAVVIDPPISDAEFNKICDYENYGEVKERCSKIIQENICDYKFVAQVLGDYLEEKKKMEVMQNSYDKYKFVREKWLDYENDFIQINNEKLRQATIKILLLTIITNREKIQSIKKAVNL